MVDNTLSEVVQLTQDLIAINSENPPGNEKGVALFIKDFLESSGIQTEVIEFMPNRCNVIAEFGKGEGIMLNGHIDTVPIGPEESWNYEPLGEIVGDKIYGRGTCDMKAGVAIMMMAAKKLQKKNLKRRLVLVFDADEESRFLGAKWLIENKRDFFEGVKYGCISEPTEGRVILSQRGFFGSKIKFYGKAAHGSTPDLGENAIYRAARFSLELERLNKELKKSTFPLLGSGTINVGTIAGGTKSNIVPDYCEIKVDRRLTYGENEETATSEYKKILDRLGIKADIKSSGSRPPFVVDPNEPIVGLLRKSGSGEATDGANWGYTEAELFTNELGIKTVVYGPGSAKAAHAPNEYVSMDEVERICATYEKLVNEWCL